jgi:hypothetical protein
VRPESRRERGHRGRRRRGRAARLPIRRLTSRETPLASIRISPTFSRVTNVDDMPARLRSRNSTS